MRRTIVALALFPGVWALALALCHPPSDPFEAIDQFFGVVFVGIVLGALAIVVRRKRCAKCRTRTLAIVSHSQVTCGKCMPGRMIIVRRCANALVIFLLPVLVFATAWMRLDSGSGGPREPDPIGDASDRNWDKKNCWTDDFATRSNGRGTLAAARDSICDLGFGIDVKYFYVFVRSAREKNSRKNLAFRFEAINEDTPPPILQWITKSRLLISYAGDVSPVDKKVSKLGGVTIEYVSTQPYGAFVFEGTPALQINPDKNALAEMTFDLLPLPNAAPIHPFALDGDFSIFGCDHEFRGIAEPALDSLEEMRQHLETIHAVTGSYPSALLTRVIRGVVSSGEGRNARLVPSDRVPGMSVIYHGTVDSYALELRFPDLQPGYEAPPEDRGTALSGAFFSCAVIHAGTSAVVLSKGGFITAEPGGAPYIGFTPPVGLYLVNAPK
jgi:hypothetical protein